MIFISIINVLKRLQADPWICGHGGHSSLSCGTRFSDYFVMVKDAKDIYYDHGEEMPEQECRYDVGAAEKEGFDLNDLPIDDL